MSGVPNDDRPPVVVAMQWVHRITSISLEMVLPAWLGHWLDQRWGTNPWLVSLGAVFGFTAAMVHLLKLSTGRTGGNPPAR